MANPTTLPEFAQAVRTTYAATRTAAQTAVADAQTALGAARDSQKAHSEDLAAAQKEIAAKRAELAATEVPANAEALLAEITSLQTQARAIQALVLDDRTAVAHAEAELAAANATLSRAAAELAAAEADFEAVVAESAQLDTLKAAATAGPAATLRADAADALTDPPYTTAKTRVEADVPEKLLEAARASVAAENARVARLEASLNAAQDLLADELETSGGLDGTVVKQRLAFDRAEADLREWVTGGPQRLRRAADLLTAVLVGDGLFTAAEAAHLADQDAVDLGEPAAELRVTREEKRQAALEAEADLEDATLAARAPDPLADVAAVQEVSDAQDALDTAAGELLTAQAAYGTDEADFTGWASAVSDGVWRKVLGFVEAEAIL
ncbi:MAG TPA: hypothetical protein VF263_21970, partial [Longimicrobiaceae bacterium]